MTTPQALAHQEAQFQRGQPSRVEAPSEEQLDGHEFQSCPCRWCREERASKAKVKRIRERLAIQVEAEARERKRLIAAGWRDPKLIWDAPF